MHYVMIPTAWVDDSTIDATQLGALVQLARLADWETGTAIVRQQTLGQRLHKSRTATNRLIKSLKQKTDGTGQPIIQTARRADRDGWEVASSYKLPQLLALHTGCAESAHQVSKTIDIQTSSDPSAEKKTPPADWQPSDEDRAWLQRERPDLSADTVTTKFLCWYRSKAVRVANTSAHWRAWAKRTAQAEHIAPIAPIAPVAHKRADRQRAAFLSTATPAAQSFAATLPPQEIRRLIGIGLLSADVAERYLTGG